MNDLPPVQDKIVIVRKANINESAFAKASADREIRFSKDLWRQMEFQMDRHFLNLNQFITYAIELYLDELLKHEIQEKKWINFSEGQFNTSKPIDIPHKSDDEDIFEGI